MPFLTFSTASAIFHARTTTRDMAFESMKLEPPKDFFDFLKNFLSPLPAFLQQQSTNLNLLAKVFA